ncbi:hypothetical protein [Vibrio mediterranei]|uniref:Prolyl 4-hydroxylase alpha subunit domain-containing protein n=1 Tax=Vibrio mediterranei TaxID=689 RepID=A0ABX5DAM1_9VIBR|nr:hypothetical protein [Vibrio mediterranei]PCD85646.1 hypothetical protein COR52_25805 [Vibrio mediterranei]PRQ66525.1 hypothetical protein COR51_16460 [Vibrio mediterranei]
MLPIPCLTCEPTELGLWIKEHVLFWLPWILLTLLIIDRLINTETESCTEQALLDRGFVKKSTIDDQLNFARSVAKRLDEHREVVEAINMHTNFGEMFPWHMDHLATQDDYLLRLFHLVHGHFPDHTGSKEVTSDEYVRARPLELGPCRLPEYSQYILRHVVEQQPDKASVEIEAYEILDGLTYTVVENSESILLKGEAFQSLFSELQQHPKAVNQLVVEGDFQHCANRLDGTPLVSSLMLFTDFLSTIAPLIENKDPSIWEEWDKLGCTFVCFNFVSSEGKSIC